MKKSDYILIDTDKLPGNITTSANLTSGDASSGELFVSFTFYSDGVVEQTVSQGGSPVVTFAGQWHSGPSYNFNDYDFSWGGASVTKPGASSVTTTGAGSFTVTGPVFAGPGFQLSFTPAQPTGTYEAEWALSVTGTDDNQTANYTVRATINYS